MKKVNSKIVELRESNGINQSEMARILGVSRTALYRYETGERTPDMDFLVKFAEYFGVSIDMLVFGDETPVATTLPITRDQILVVKYHGAKEGVRESVDILLEMPKETEKTDNIRNIRPMERRAPLSVSLQGVSAGTGTYLYPDDFRTIQVKESLLPYGVKFAVPIEGDSMEPKFHDGQLALVGEDYAEEGEIGIFAVNGDGYIKELRGDHLHSLNPNYEDIPYDCESIHPIGKIIGVLDSVDIEE